MKVDVSTVSSYQKKLQFTIPAADVRGELETAFQRVGRNARLRGFRQGKAPRKVLEMRFGPQVRQDVANELIQRSYSSAVNEHELQPVSRPNLEAANDLEAKNDFEFTITVEVKPSIDVKNYKDLEVVFPKVDVSKEELDLRLNARLEERSKLVEVKREVQNGDLVMVELSAKNGDEELASEPGTMIRTESDPYYPGVEAILLGMSTGDTKTENVDFSDECRTEALAGKSADVTVTIQSIQANEVPKLSAKVAKELGYDGLKHMKDTIKEEIAKGKEDLVRNQARANLLQAIIDANEFDVPSGMVDQNLEMLLNELRLQEAYQGRDPRSMTFSEPQLADLRVRAEFATKAGLILEWVSDNQKLDVTEADLEAKYQELADMRGQSLEAIRGYFSNDEAIGELKDRLLEEKTLDWLLDQAKLIDEPKEEKKAAPKKTAKAKAKAKDSDDSDKAAKPKAKKSKPKAKAKKSSDD
jgi:trigger factor